jgi:rubrerythrin
MTRRFFNICIAIEKTIGQIYRQLAATQEYDPELRAIWERMAEEEDKHARDLLFASRLPEQGNFAPNASVMAKVSTLRDSADRALDKVRSERLAAKAAVELSLQLENQFLELHIESAVTFEDESLRKMFAAIVCDDKEHCRAIFAYHASHFSA